VRSGGVVLVIAGVWVLCQVLGGNALERLGIIGQADSDTTVAGGGSIAGVPDKGYSGVPHNAQGYPL
jgi:hypothetical protein